MASAAAVTGTRAALRPVYARVRTALSPPRPPVRRPPHACRGAVSDATKNVSAPAQATKDSSRAEKRRVVLSNRLTLRDFIDKARVDALRGSEHGGEKCGANEAAPATVPPYLDAEAVAADLCGRTYAVETYGCQMNTNDTEILCSILNASGMTQVESTENTRRPDFFFLVTCAVRDSAERKIWQRISELSAESKRSRSNQFRIGVLGCMAERLKDKLFDSGLVSVVCGPDAYRSLPTLLAINRHDNTLAANVMLSADETYADVNPTRKNNVSAMISVMRGCNNMCAFCVVPFTRGVERSLPTHVVVETIKKLSDQGIREVTLLGQNVNSYFDGSPEGQSAAAAAVAAASSREVNQKLLQDQGIGDLTATSGAFETVYQRRIAMRRREDGLRFADLLDRVSDVNPEMRVRFTSPHPKDFPIELLNLIATKHNLCRQIHLPAQSGSTECLARMRRGYSRSTYDALVKLICKKIPEVSLSTDLIVGFCDETEQEFEQTLDLVEQVEYDVAYMFAYSMRERTMAHRRLQDSVPHAIKLERLARLVKAQYAIAKAAHERRYTDKIATVLVDGPAKRGDQISGRAECNLRVNFDIDKGTSLRPGDYALVRITGSTGATLRGTFVCRTTLKESSQAQRNPFLQKAPAIPNTV